jgi:hypothetical protein
MGGAGDADSGKDTRKTAGLQPIVRVVSERHSAWGHGWRARLRGKSGEQFQWRGGSGLTENRKSFPGTPFPLYGLEQQGPECASASRSIFLKDLKFSRQPAL